MKSVHIHLLLFVVLLGINKSFAQGPPAAQGGAPVMNPPVSVEMMAGSRGLSYQMIVNKKFQSVPRLGFFSVSNFQTDWKSSAMRDYMMQGNLTLSLVKGLDISSGFIWTPYTGIRPSAGIMYTFANKDWLIVANPRTDLTKNANMEVLALAEYKPMINEKLKFYSRLQGLYTQDTGIGDHGRSYIMARAGITIKDVTFGAGANFDFYGPQKIKDHNIGGFVNINLF